MKIRVPGDKSLTQRALLLAALADGESRLSGLLWGGDAASTAGALHALGGLPGTLPRDGSEIRVRGVGLQGLFAPETPVDLGNSGTGARLLLGVLAGAGVPATLTGDESLRRRPMGRVVDPLRAMGARLEYVEAKDRLPVRVLEGGAAKPLDWPSPVASAQVKSAILLAGVTAGAFVAVTQPRRSRDHTERLLTAMGAPVIGHAVQGGFRVELRDPPARLAPLDFTVPGDASSAAFFLALAALGGAGGALEVEGVGLNPTRTGFLTVLERMGARVTVSPEEDAGPEPIGSVRVEPGDLRAVEVGADEVPGLIDELPLVAVLGARASGTTRITGAEELRHKESDRIAVLADNLRTLGARVRELPDGLEVDGGAGRLEGGIRAHGDHRVAMAFGVLGAAPDALIEVDEHAAADVSFPGFWELLDRVSGRESAS